MKIIIDSYIPYIKGVLDPVAEVKYMTYQEMTPESIREADALIVRTRTRCNEKLLKGSKVKFIASATIGYDHIDTDYCSRNNIYTTNAPGCNALSVAQYMASALCFLSRKHQFDLSDKTIGIVGVGAVGSKIEALAKAFGMRVLLSDPPRARREGNGKFIDLNTICQKADLISFHTPLNVSGKDATLFLGNESFFESLKKKPIIINAARGEIVKSASALAALERGLIRDFVADCWENEPDISRELMAHTSLATPHIAGYSADGKANAATQSVQAISRFFSLGLNDWRAEELPAPFAIDKRKTETIEDFFLTSYNIEADSKNLKENPEEFESLRSNYFFRREPKAYLPFLEKKTKEELVQKFGLFFSQKG